MAWMTPAPLSLLLVLVRSRWPAPVWGLSIWSLLVLPLLASWAQYSRMELCLLTLYRSFERVSAKQACLLQMMQTLLWPSGPQRRLQVE